ncbi:HNH endonuclease [Williamsia serinedens]|uniref:HNH endonuclease n=1 Tax=Williamsia serinedens TaxID=391736 RepID=A0ABT1H7G2_9NOCA|nr:HNH endonuclease [Williamsia serinedens]MCP2162672.1 HNH endonuclease [Williamsia serinedens]
MSRVSRNTTIRDRHRTQLARTKPPCAYEHCLFPGEPIDYDAHHLDPKAFQADHVIPVDAGGPDTLANKVPMHRACNRHKWKSLPGDDTGARVYETDRTW